MSEIAHDENRRRITFAVEVLRDREAPEADRVAARKVLHDIGDQAATAQGAVSALVKIAVKGPAADMRGVALNELKRLGVDPSTYQGGQ